MTRRPTDPARDLHPDAPVVEVTPERQEPRWNPDPEEVRRSVVQLVLTLVELIHQILERQTLRRMEEGSLDEQQLEDLGTALMRLEETIAEIAETFGVDVEDLNLDLGPLGKLL